MVLFCDSIVHNCKKMLLNEEKDFEFDASENEEKGEKEEKVEKIPPRTQNLSENQWNFPEEGMSLSFPNGIKLFEQKDPPRFPKYSKLKQFKYVQEYQTNPS